MSIKEQLTADIQTAMKNRDEIRLTTLRGVLGEIQNQEKLGKSAREFNDQEVLSVLTKQAKQRRESALIYKDAGQHDRFQRESAEAEIIESYLPTQLTEDEVAALVDAEVQNQGATTMRDMGKVVKAVLAKAEGRTDGKTVSTLVKARLS